MPALPLRISSPNARNRTNGRCRRQSSSTSCRVSVATRVPSRSTNRGGGVVRPTSPTLSPLLANWAVIGNNRSRSDEGDPGSCAPHEKSAGRRAWLLQWPLASKRNLLKPPGSEHPLQRWPDSWAEKTPNHPVGADATSVPENARGSRAHRVPTPKAWVRRGCPASPAIPFDAARRRVRQFVAGSVNACRPAPSCTTKYCLPSCI
jgi:hypothetical protein